MEEYFKKIVKIQKELRDAVSPAGKPYNICGIDPTPTYFDGNLLKGALIFYGGDGCSWNTETGGCFMCPYSTAHERIGYTQEHVKNQIEYLENLEEIKEFELVYLFPYSSFDEREVSFANQKRLWKVLSELDNLKYVVFESRPEYITEKVLKGISDTLPEKKVCVYIGLETSCDFIRKYCINKGFSFDMFRKKCELLQEYNMNACAFVLLKPPFSHRKRSYYRLRIHHHRLCGYSDKYHPHVC